MSLRASYGITGSEALGSYQSLATLNNTYNYIFGNTVYVGVGPGRISNPDLRWESTSQLDVGLDLGVFNNRIGVTVDYYNKKTSDLLFNKSIPNQSGYNTTLVNVGSIGNKGLEFSVRSQNLMGELKWNTNANIYFNRSKVLAPGAVNEQLYGGSNYLAEGQFYVLRVGETVGSFYGYKDDGIFQTQDEVNASAQKTAKPGDMRYVDVDKNGAINALDGLCLVTLSPIFFMA